MKPSQLKEAIKGLYAANQPAFTWGAPGIGKSSIFSQVAAELGIGFLDLRVSLLEPVDLRGIPSIANGQTVWCAPNFLPTDGAGFIFLDELPQGNHAMQAACLQLTLDRRLGEWTCPPQWVPMAAGNRLTDRAGGHSLISALSSRFVHLDLEIDNNEWCKWALANGILPEIVAFIRFRPNLLHAFDPKARAFPCPRTWEFASRVVGSKLSADIELEVLTGTIGEGPAIELVSFLKMWRAIPNIDAVLLNPATADVPSEASVKFAVAGAIARKATSVNFDRVLTYAQRLGEEFAGFVAMDSTARDASLANTAAFDQFAIENDHLFN